ncbi:MULTISPECIES: diguanylate cyclase [unclassified Thioalkalivibrio]|uniref:sensor domain-containing diguanylate cyclase n=1 Tax=unclassified Thioalkalivibrio TaxID=2621013 RepID=UPI00036596C7|nr:MULTISPECIES: diguanylate cyclase [unclassified Thioalkalivibrio]
MADDLHTRFHTLIIEHAPVWVNTLDTEGRVTLWNRAAERISGYRREDVVGHAAIWEWLYPDADYRAAIQEEVEAIIRDGREIAGLETTIRTRSGEARTLSWAAQRFFDDDGTLIGASAIAEDITRRKHLEARAQRQQRLQALVSAISARFADLAADAVDAAVTEVLRDLGEFFQTGRAYVIRFRPDGATMDLVHEWCAPGVQPFLDQMQGIPMESHGWVTGHIRRRDTVHVPDVDDLPPEAAVEQAEFRRQMIESLLLIPLISDQNAFGMLGFDSVNRRCEWSPEEIATLQVVADIIAGTFARKQAEAELARQARVDGLTGLANRREFDAVLERECRSRREVNLALLMIDIDHFKPYNDRFGHQRGDDCLRQVARVLREAAHRPTDLVARYGGEEFACILPDTTLEGARAVGERVRREVEALQLEHPDNVTATVTVSLGVSTVSGARSTTPEALLGEADRLLYCAKREGRNRVCAAGL